MNFDDYTTGEVRLEDLEFPTPIYKYRKWITKKHKTALTERKIKMSAPTTFDDKFDCKNRKLVIQIAMIKIKHFN